ncbi:5,6-dimethylbenzimidazole synthase [Nitrogeniibacter mangrovi]|uniref:5,6-dimethylbenzimidazole synthase n=1 Tax=Nitrogeniibacter mangrovi TaxID=2016596 RepID=A0A6C1B2V5_9RHOO|nr:5,6-dimethylbenzimidazole synthase [Nitrogeniibacter mangrovi]QID17168.1 5,6-dimethylbenzimidazole synthase [Nitrogeniibacter mangrovi]
MQASNALHAHAFSREERATIYRNMLARRDVRSQFVPDPVDDAVLARILTAAHFAPSVGFMQPWSFVLVRDPAVKQRAHEAFTQANAEAADMFEGARREAYKSLRLEGILEAPVNLCITCDRDRDGPVVLGRTHQKAMDLYSTVCAVQNLWLAARAEGLGVGWVSIFHKAAIRDILQLPERVMPVAYLCIGHVSHFLDRPELEAAGWRARLPLDQLIHFDCWDGASPSGDALKAHLREAQALATNGCPPL